MFSTRDGCPLIRASIVGLLLIASGCAHRQYDQPKAEATSLPPEDAASIRRVWPRQEAVYANTQVIAGPRGFNYGSDPSRPQYQNQAWESVNFFWQSLWLPVDLIVNPPTQSRAYNTQPTETTFTAAPVPLADDAPTPESVLPPAPGPVSGSPPASETPAPQTGSGTPGSTAGQGGPPGTDRPGSDSPSAPGGGTPATPGAGGAGN